MRKHDVRKWLHAILDLLPVILIPVFMIYSHRHDINDGSIQVQEKIAIDFNQLQPNNFNVSSNNGITLEVVNNNYIHAYGTSSDRTYFAICGAPQRVNSYVITAYDILSVDGVYRVGNFNNGGSISYLDTGAKYFSNASFSFGLDVYANQTIDITFTFMIFDLTQMGIEDYTYAQFRDIFDASYYSYVVSDKQLILGDLVTYNYTDIMSQFTYQLYNSVDKYFNVGNVFHLNEVYDWFNLNIFNGNAPLYIYIVYQIVLYELIMDLLMLLYSLFMWFIDMIQKLMEKPLNSVK